MKKQNFSILKRLKSFNYAANGFRILLQEEHNARIHFFALTLVILAGILFKISTNEWLAIIIVSCFVITSELFNSSLENIADFISPDKHPQLKKIKDLAAAAVLTSAIAAALTGIIIFLPKII